MNETTFQNDVAVRVAVWKPNGEKCPDTNFLNGSGIKCWYYENGQKMWEKNYKDGKPDGLWPRWYYNGKKESEQGFRDGLGVSFKKWDKEDKDKKSKAREPGAKVVVTFAQFERLERRDGVYYFEGAAFTGIVVKKHANEQKSEEINFRDGIPDGLLTRWYENGQKSEEITFKAGMMMDGLATEWHISGQKKAERTYKDKKLISERFWDEEGKPLRHAQQPTGQESGNETEAPEVLVDSAQVEKRDDGLYYFNGNPFTGVRVQRDQPYGPKAIETTYKDGKKAGWSTTFWRTNAFKTGPKHREGLYKDDKKDGLWIEWYQHGQKSEEATWKDGKKHGPGTEWYENGQKSSERTYKDGEKHGLETNWNRNGQKSFERTYKDGKKDGLMTRYSNGQKEWEGTYKDDKLISSRSW
jgi:antitoxin component YwqK of YwqJK toxin-antitoxin module